MGTGWTSPTHIILLLLIALLLFGAKRLPEIGRSLGKGMREFKDSVTGHDEPDHSMHELTAPPPEKPVAAARPREHDTV
jgi:sec-independent protein translocase protein TatA